MAARGRGGSGFNPLHCGAVVASSLAPERGQRLESFNPLHCGAVVASELKADADEAARVSIPFIAGQWSLRPAVRGGDGAAAVVSIPFIAGQWSLPAFKAATTVSRLEFQSPSLRGSGRFNWPPARSESPGRVFQSPSLRGSGRFGFTSEKEEKNVPTFQSPSLRGSGRFGFLLLVLAITIVFQSPSLRGSGRFSWPKEVVVAVSSCFNPLHCGAVVASSSPVCRARRMTPVSIPFIAGQWSLQIFIIGDGGFDIVSIPFIAGQWSLRQRRILATLARDEFQSPSLRGSGRFVFTPRRGEPDGGCFNPLHCGAVVASTNRRSVAPARGRCFNPLHCGAVVASRRRPAPPPGARATVSIPFIAGQWSLLGDDLAEARTDAVQVSIPFIAGQWSLRGELAATADEAARFQSPSLRGSGRFKEKQ